MTKKKKIEGYGEVQPEFKKIKLEEKAGDGATHQSSPVPPPIGLGVRVRDVVTGTVGVATTKSRNMAGTVRYGVQAPAVGGLPPEPLLYDNLQLEALEKACDIVEPNYGLLKVELGQKAQDVVSGFTGVVVELIEFMNGCIYVSLQPPVDPKKPNIFPDSTGFPCSRIIPVEGKKVKVIKEAQKKGGPVVRATRTAV